MCSEPILQKRRDKDGTADQKSQPDSSGNVAQQLPKPPSHSSSGSNSSKANVSSSKATSSWKFESMSSVPEPSRASTSSSHVSEQSSGTFIGMIGNYEKRQELGKGGFGIVYRVRKGGRSARLKHLEKQMQEYSDRTEYGKAQEIKQKIENWKSYNKQVEKLEKQMKNAADKQDFGKAEALKKQVIKLTAEMPGAEDLASAQDGQTEYAMKEMKEQNAKSLAAAKKEANFLAELKHNHIIEFIDKFIVENKLYIVTEYANQGDLRNAIRRQKAKEKQGGDRWSYQSITIWFVQILCAVGYLHARKFLHRDLKPDNIFVTQTGNSRPKLKIGDFGLATVMESDRSRHTVAGTKIYMSPEQLDGHYGLPADMWALGVILFELCTLKVPFKTVSAVVKPPASGDPTVYKTMGKFANDKWRTLSLYCEDALNRNASIRCQCGELAERFYEFLSTLRKSASQDANNSSWDHAVQLLSVNFHDGVNQRSSTANSRFEDTL